MAAILITGGTGYLGQWLIRHFAASGLTVSTIKAGAALGVGYTPPKRTAGCIMVTHPRFCPKKQTL